MKQRWGFILGFFLATAIAWWVGGKLPIPMGTVPIKQAPSTTAPLNECGNHSNQPDQTYCERDLSVVQLHPPCEALTLPAFREECRWREAIIKRDPTSCDQLSADRRDLCLWDVSVARHAYADRPQQADFRLCEQIQRSDLKRACRETSYAMGSD